MYTPVERTLPLSANSDFMLQKIESVAGLSLYTN
jgi:hypothetical protein